MFFWLKQVEILVFDVPKPGKNKKNILVKIVLIFLNHDVNKKACYYQNKIKGT